MTKDDILKEAQPGTVLDVSELEMEKLFPVSGLQMPFLSTFDQVKEFCFEHKIDFEYSIIEGYRLWKRNSP